jgi:predicted nucleic acid-binding protein
VFSAVLDACVLFPQSLRDALIRLAEAELYTPLWSERVLEEMRSSLVEDRGIHPEKADRTVSLLREAFEEAEVDAIKIASLEPAMTNDEKDRHVLATAVAAGSELVVTFNVSDFPSTACEPVGVAAVHPAAFLSDLVDLDADTVYRVIAELVAGLRATNFDEFLEMLENAGVPSFVTELRAHQERRLRSG